MDKLFGIELNFIQALNIEGVIDPRLIGLIRWLKSAPYQYYTV